MNANVVWSRRGAGIARHFVRADFAQGLRARDVQREKRKKIGENVDV